MRTLLCALLLCASIPSWAQMPKRFQFRTKLDQFELLLNGNNSSIEGQAADLSTFRDLLPLLTKDLGEECPVLRGKADVTVTDLDKNTSRSLFLLQAVVTDGQKCLFISGDGLLYFPLHRNWFLANKSDGLLFGQTLSLSRNGKRIATFTRKAKQWTQANPDFFPDWDFLSTFQESLTSFTVRMHGQLALAKGKPLVILQTGGKTYRLYQVTPSLWGLEKPGQPWLVFSKDWNAWFNLEPQQFEDHRATKIRSILDKTQTVEQRLEELGNLETGWSRSIRDMYARLLTNPSEDPRLAKIALERLRSKPSLENAGLVIAFLEHATDPELKKLATQILRIQNPKGPALDLSQSEEQQRKTIEEWSRWWKKSQPAE